MTTSFRNRSRSQWFRLYQSLKKRLAKKLVAGSIGAGLVTTIVAGSVVPVPTRSAQHMKPAGVKLACQPPSVDLAFIIDRSGSFDIAKVGQAYNVQIDGVLRALRDPSVIPRDGSVAVTVETFAGSGAIQVPFKQIDTAADAEGIALVVESLRCTAVNCTPSGSCPLFGSNPASNYAPAITTADEHLKDNHRIGARRALLLSSDGQPSDPEEASIAARRAGDELDIILMTLDPDARKDSADQSERDAFEAFQAAKAKADTIVSPQPPDDFPGKTLPIKNGVCDNRCASLDDGAVKADCDRQVKEFAELTRDVLRRRVARLELTVNTQADPMSDIPNTLSLSQAIVRANDNGGSTEITFTSAVKTIRPLMPLPALTSPGITIDGIEGRDSLDPVTIDGAMTTVAHGEERDDGILIRSNRCHVRGLKITNFKRAGVGVEPVSMCDNVGFNVIERNRFENNKAGVCVLDPPPGPGAIFHNIGNTISMNDVSGSKTPIDLGSPAPFPPTVTMSVCDGPTPNDEGDLDEGPNTLLNIPTIRGRYLAGGVGGTVTITGFVNSPPPGGGTVEIFAQNFKSIQNAVVFDSVVYLGSTSLIGNSFTAKDLPASPAGAYSATLTDSSGNTSELEICSDAPALQLAQRSFAFRAIDVGASDLLSFEIKNPGCAAVNNLDFKLFRIVGKKEKKDDSGIFSVEPQGPQKTFPMRIEPSDTQTFNLRFTPAIPPFVAGFASSPSLLLPERIHGILRFSSDAGEASLDIFADVAPRVLLINADGTQDHPAPTLTRSGDIFEVIFYVFDSDPFDIKDAVFEFAFDDNGKCITVPVDHEQASLAEVITKAFNPPPPAEPTKRIGQSLKIIQRFSNANQHPETRFVKVTVSGANSTAPCCAFACDQAAAQAVHNGSGTTLVLPPLKLIPGGSSIDWRRAVVRTEKLR